MDFSVRALHDLEEKIQTLSDNVSEQVNCRKIEDVTIDLLKSRSITKEILMGIVLKMGTVISDSRVVLRSALAKFDEQRSDLLDNQKTLIQTQNELITCKTGKLDSVQETVKSEIKTFSEVLKQSCTGNNITPAKLKKVVRSAMTEDDRTKNFLIFGADEEMFCEDYELDDKALVEDIFSLLKEKPAIENCKRLGTKQSDGTQRPIKVTLRTAEAVHQVLGKAKNLKTVDVTGYSFEHKKLYLSPDRSEEERRTRQKLVQEMKQRIRNDSSKRYFIKYNRVCIAGEPSP